VFGCSDKRTCAQSGGDGKSVLLCEAKRAFSESMFGDDSDLRFFLGGCEESLTLCFLGSDEGTSPIR
jgi:hypothetical protein